MVKKELNIDFKNVDGLWDLIDNHYCANLTWEKVEDEKYAGKMFGVSSRFMLGVNRYESDWLPDSNSGYKKENIVIGALLILKDANLTKNMYRRFGDYVWDKYISGREIKGLPGYEQIDEYLVTSKKWVENYVDIRFEKWDYNEKDYAKIVKERRHIVEYFFEKIMDVGQQHHGYLKDYSEKEWEILKQINDFEQKKLVLTPEMKKYIEKRENEDKKGKPIAKKKVVEKER